MLMLDCSCHNAVITFNPSRGCLMELVYICSQEISARAEFRPDCTRFFVGVIKKNGEIFHAVQSSRIVTL